MTTCRSNHSLPRLASMEALALILVPSIATVPNLPKPARAAEQQYLREQVTERVLRIDAEPRDRGMVRAVLRAQDAKRDVSDAHPLDLPRGPHSLAVRIDQQPEQHLRVIPRRACPTATPVPLQRAGVKRIDGLQHEPRQMIRRKPLPHVNRQQHRLITQHWTIRLGHAT